MKAFRVLFCLFTVPVLTVFLSVCLAAEGCEPDNTSVQAKCGVIDLGFMTLTLTPSTGATTVWVDDDAPNDPAPGDPETSDPLESGTMDHPFDSIQEGIDAATSADTVFVRSGTYTGTGNRDISFRGKAITVEGEGGSGEVLIDCENAGTGFAFYLGETNSSILRGVTIANGANPGGSGGGIACSGSQPTIEECVITGCTAASGAGICLWNSNAAISCCEIRGNHASNGGGGILCWQSSPAISECVIEQNSAPDGGGVHCDTSSPAITECRIRDNTAQDDGGGIYCTTNSSPSILRCVMMWNSAGDDGGGMHLRDNSNPAITNCVVASNHAVGLGGGMDCYVSWPTVMNCTITNNTSDFKGGGLSAYNSYVVMRNCILWNDYPDEVYVGSGSPGPALTYCDVENGAGELWFGTGCIDADPLFLPVAGGVYRLRPYSPCIDAGTSDSSAPASDIMGHPRWDDPMTEPNTGSGAKGDYYDMGVSEFKCFYVNGDPTVGSDAYDGLGPSYDGATGHGPKRTILAAVNAASDGDVIHVASWEYTGAGNRDMYIDKAVYIVSGSGSDGTVINCQGSSGDPHRAFHFEDCQEPGAVICGFTIRNGFEDYGGAIYAFATNLTVLNCVLENDSNPSSSSAPVTTGGGAMCCWSSHVEVRNCVFRDNAAGYAGGGGIRLNDCGDSLVADCVFENNYTWTYGGAISIGSCSPEITGCTMSGNQTNNYGGAIYMGSGSDPSISNCVFSANRSEGTPGLGRNGAICVWNGSSPTISNCIFSENFYSYDGVVGCSVDCSPVISNCTFAGNRCLASLDGTLDCYSNSSPQVINCIFWDNGDLDVSADGTSLPLLSYCDVETMTGTEGWIGPGCINKDPLFLYAEGEDYRLSPGSPCIDAGTSTGTPATDIDDRARYDDPMTTDTGGGPDSFFDIGAHEFKAYYVNGGVGSNSNNGLYRNPSGSPNGPKKTIQAAIDAAGHDDFIIVAAGTYKGTGNRDLLIQGKDVVMISESGADKTVVDCEADFSDEHRGLSLSGLSSRMFIRGFQITGAYWTSGPGGAIALDEADATILDMRLVDNSSTFGGGIGCGSSNPAIIGCVLSNNDAVAISHATGDGGALHIDGGNPIIKNCLISMNNADDHGGGIMCSSGSPEILDCTIYGNAAGTVGGGMCTESGPVVRDCILWNNSPESFHVSSGTPDVTYSDIQGGTGQTWFGAGCLDSSPYFTSGPLHNFYLCDPDLQGIKSPCINSGSAPSSDLGLDKLTTRTDGRGDEDAVDMGYHSPHVLRITAISLSGNDVIIEWNAVPGVDYWVEWSPNLEEWHPVFVGAVGSWSNINAGLLDWRYYRVGED